MENKQRDIVYGYVRINYDGQNMVNDIIQIIYQYYLIVLDSVILTDYEDIDAFRSLLSPRFISILNTQNFELKLLYRNSRDGNSSDSFHKHCNGHLNTLTLVQSNYGNIFGGFTTRDWGARSAWTEDDLAFLFRIKSKFNHPPKIFENKVKDDGAIYVSAQFGPMWGVGYDLFLQYRTSMPHSNLGVTYEGEGNELCGGDVERTDKEDHKFDLIEYEVFAVE